LDAERGADMARSRRQGNRSHEDLIVAGGWLIAHGGALRQACVWRQWIRAKLLPAGRFCGCGIPALPLGI